MARAAALSRPLVIKRFKNVDLARGMSVVGGVDGKVRVIARYGTHRRQKLFHMDTPLIDRLAWQHETIERLRLLAAGKLTNPTLREDIDAYLSSQRGRRLARAEQWLAYWAEWYGYLPRAELTLGQCQAFFEHVTPKSNPQASFSPSSLNKFRTYLINVWRYHDGRRHECPVLDIPVFPEPIQETRELRPEEIAAILGVMDDTPNRARLGLLYVTGCRPTELTTLIGEKFHLDQGIPYVQIRSAKDGKHRMVPLPPFGVDYARDFLRHRAWEGKFNNLYRDMQRAASRVGLAVFTGEAHPGGRRKVRISPYCLRHTYAMNLRRAGAGIDDIADALGHKSLETTRRYAQAIPERQAAVTAKMWGQQGI